MHHFTSRSTLSRTEQFKRGLAMVKRLSELRYERGWSEKEAELALDLCDEALPTKLHSMGTCALFCTTFYDLHAAI